MTNTSIPATVFVADEALKLIGFAEVAIGLHANGRDSDRPNGILEAGMFAGGDIAQGRARSWLMATGGAKRT